MGGRAIPQGYDSKADWALGITSQMRANEKSSTSSVAEVLAVNNASVAKLISQEKANHWSNTSGAGSITTSMNHADALRMNKLNDEKRAVEVNNIEFPSLSSMEVNAGEISDYAKTLETNNAPVEIDTSKLAATSQFMSNYNDNQLYENQNLNDEILGTTKGDLETTVHNLGVGSGRGLVVEDAGDRAFHLKNQALKDEILESQAIEKQVNEMIAAAEIQTAEKQQALDDARQTFHFKDLNKDGKVTIDEEEQHYLNQNNGLDYSEQLAAELADEGENVTGSFFESSETSILPIDEDSVKELEILKNGEFTLSDGSVVPANGHDATWHENLLQEKITAEKNAAEIMQEIEDEAEAAAKADRYAKQFADSQDTSTAPDTFATSLAKGSEELQDALKSGEVEVNTIGSGGSAVQTANAEVEARVEGLKEQEVMRVQRKQAHNLEQDAFGGQGTQSGLNAKHLTGEADSDGEWMAGQHEKFKDEKHGGETEARKAQLQAERMASELDRVDEELHNGEAARKKQKEKERMASELDRIDEELHGGEAELQERLKADEHSKTLGLRHRGVGKETAFQTHTRKKDSLAVQLATHNMPLFMTDEAKKRMAGILDRIDEERDGGDKEAANQWKKWNNDPFRFSTFAYPRDVTVNQENGHYILFYVNVQNKTKYSYDGITESQHRVPVGDMMMIDEVRQRGTGEYKKKYLTGALDKWNYEEINEDYVHTEWKEGASSEFDTNIDYHKRRVLVGHKGQILRSNQVDLMKGRKSYQGLDSVMKTTTRITDSVALYLPPGVSDNTTVSYSPDSLGMAGFMAFSFGDIVNQWKARDFEGVADTILDMGGTALVEAMKSMGLGAFGMATGADEGSTLATFDKAFGQTLNPYIEVNFNSMGMRDFTYTFHFSPKSAQETQDVQDIIQLFRFHMAPELKGTNHRYLTLPSTFDIHYMYQTSPENAKENPFYNKIATCVLTNCSVDYTPNGVRSFEDGAPTQINMTLSFSETKMLTKQKINDGF